MSGRSVIQSINCAYVLKPQWKLWASKLRGNWDRSIRASGDQAAAKRCSEPGSSPLPASPLSVLPRRVPGRSASRPQSPQDCAWALPAAHVLCPPSGPLPLRRPARPGKAAATSALQAVRRRPGPRPPPRRRRGPSHRRAAAAAPPRPHTLPEVRHSHGAGACALPGGPGPRHPHAALYVSPGPRAWASRPASSPGAPSWPPFPPQSARLPSQEASHSPLGAPRPTGREEGAQGLRSTPDRGRGMLSPDNPRLNKPLPAGSPSQCILRQLWGSRVPFLHLLEDPEGKASKGN
uniref:Uncharacterized protein LOC112806733 n=1 Tax=Callorhinus ursinus TaxID=34884 RepID=A0A3Q7NN93_CALUR|nr:uncharacterized protein LOC112806733 [Callorhinus ursinus]